MGRLSRWLAPAVLLLVCTGFFWKIVLTDQYTWLEGSDLAYQVLPWLQMQSGEWHRGRVALWDPYLWGGQSLIGQVITGAASPINWILFLLPLRRGWIQQAHLNWLFVLIHFLGAWFGYLLCRDLKRSQAASVAGGCAFALGGWVGATDWPQMLTSTIWAPLVLLFLLRSLRGWRPVASAAASGAFLGASFLGSHHQVPVFLILATGGIWLYMFLRRGRPDWVMARLAAIFLVFMILVSGLQTVPAYEYGKLAKRWVGLDRPIGWNEPVPYSVHSQYSLIPTSLLAVVIPGVARHADPFIGVTALSLALLAVAMAWKELPVRLFAAIGAGGLLFSLGQDNVFHGMLYALVPVVEKARSPSMAIFIYHFGIAILTAYGIDYILPSAESPWPRRATVSLAWLGVLLFISLGVLVLVQKPPGDDRFAVVALISLLLAWLLAGWRGGLVTQTTAAVLALGLMLIEFGNSSGFYWPNKEDETRNVLLKQLAGDSDLAAFLTGIPWPVRIEVSAKDIPYNFGDWYGIDQFGGYLASLPLNLLALPWQLPHIKKIFGVNIEVKRGPPGPGQMEVFQSARGLKAYLNLDAFPRAWAVHEVQQVGERSLVDGTLSDKSFDLKRRTVLLEQPPALESCSGQDDVRLTRRNSGRVTIEAVMACRGMVILGDSYFPGWRATVDGRRTKIYEAYAAVRGVVVEKGKHTIEMRYLPLSVVAGGLMTLAGVAGAVLLNVGTRRKEKGGERWPD
ncbi:MAG: YfhO family protein [Bryobacteraceae bacterium]